MLIGGRIRLVPTRREYIESYVKWTNYPEITQYTVMYRSMKKKIKES
jgi:hypothetical protein